tara:strand:+ start:527 stop:1219 length:693 start_codon:yes stop_codon:yes gene_type:complete
MSVNVNTVYSRVLAILNKEQRGFLTPQEFNLFANQAQMDIFEQYFYDINQFGRLHGNDTEFSDMLNILNEKIAPFIKEGTTTFTNGGFPRPTDFYRLGNIRFGTAKAQRLNRNEFLVIDSAPLTAPSNSFPVFYENEKGFVVHANAPNPQQSGVTIDYIAKPTTVAWAGTNVNGVPQYNESNSSNFDLHGSEETELVIKILELAGLLIKDPSIYQAAVTDQTRNIQQEKA